MICDIIIKQLTSNVYHAAWMRSLLNFPDVKSEYLSCLKRLANLISEHIDSDTERSRTLKELRDESLHVEVELSPARRQTN